MIYGIDVAKWQGVINWEQVSKTKKEFAIIKITNKTNGKDSQFENNLAGATKYGLMTGVYRYVYAQNTAMAQEEANAIVKALNGRKLKLGVWLDLEDISIKNIGKVRLSDIIHTEARILQKAGYDVGIYCNKDWYYNVLDHEELKRIYPFWIARYSKYDIGIEPISLCPSAYGQGWQYSSKGKVAGINGNVDLDVFFEDTSVLFKPSAPKPTLRQHDSGVSVAQLQKCLNWFGYNLVVDGSFGPKTYEALLSFQQGAFSDEAEHDGIYGGKTYRKVHEMLLML